MADAQIRASGTAAAMRKIDLYIARKQAAHLDWYRAAVWEIFKRLLRQTPQFSGRAVANWTLGIGAPSAWFDPNLGEGEDWAVTVQQGKQEPHKRGDPKWMRVARERERPKLDLITRRTKVYFCNNVPGDSDNGHFNGPNKYLAELQDPGYWQEKLRDVNRPYETAQETILALTNFGTRKYGAGLFSSQP